jgi:sodium-dependent dicarboxylate transporter 2/3/5
MPGNRGRTPGICLIAGPLFALILILSVDLAPGRPEVTRTAAVAVLMAVWWIGEAVPLAVTSLLPVILFPLLGVMAGRDVAPVYFNHVIFLFIGGFLVALGMERWDLHRRIALRILIGAGVRPRNILLGAMTATAFLSMWISNTASAMIMVPIALALVLKLEESLGAESLSRYPTGLFLGIAYGASIGGIATLVGTPPNLSFVRILSIGFPEAPEITFSTWFLFALPISATILLFVWLYLSGRFCGGVHGVQIDRDIFRREHRKLGPISFEQGVILADFLLLVFLWIFRTDIRLGSLTLPGWSRLVPSGAFLDDGTVAITLAVILFVIPARSTPGRRIMDWETASRLPWDIVLLIGGGFALAAGFRDSGLSLWLGERLEALGALAPLLIVALICTMITFLTELTSNTATAQMLLPILGVMAAGLRLNPLLLMIPGTLSCSLAFMLPVATPPNAIVFGTGRLRISEMARTGLIINLIGIVVVTGAMFLLGRPVFGIALDRFPSWAAGP